MVVVELNIWYATASNVGHISLRIPAQESVPQELYFSFWPTRAAGFNDSVPSAGSTYAGDVKNEKSDPDSRNTYDIKPDINKMKQCWSRLLQEDYSFKNRNCADAVEVILMAGSTDFGTAQEVGWSRPYDKDGTYSQYRALYASIQWFRNAFIQFLLLNPGVIIEAFKK